MTDSFRPSPEADSQAGKRLFAHVSEGRRALWRGLLAKGVAAVAVVWIVLGLAIVGVQHWVLPRLSEQRIAVAEFIGRAIGEPVTIGALEAEWRGLNPQVAISELRFHDSNGVLVFELPRVSASVSWRSLFALELRLNNLVLESPALRVGRNRDGAFFVAGVNMQGPAPVGAGLRKWLLRQSDVLLTSGRVDWVDERRAAPVLHLDEVQFRLRNRRGGRHDVALKARPPAQLASPIDLRGNLRGESLDDLEHWTGDLYVRFERIDLAGFTPWIDYPAEVRTGAGALTAWATLKDSRLVSAVADLSLEQVRVHLAPEAPWFELARLSGRLTGRETATGRGPFSFFGQRYAGYRFEASDLSIQPIGGELTEQVDILLDWRGGEPAQAGEGSLRINRIDLAALVPLAGALPLPAVVRSWLAEAVPRGVLSDLQSNWSGSFDAPTRGRLGTRFSGLALRAHNGVPGFEHLEGRLDFDDRSGHLLARGHAFRMSAAAWLPQAPTIDWDRIDLDLTWEGNLAARAGPSSLRILQAEASNRDLSLSATGRWSASGSAPGMLDLAIKVPRAELRALDRYLPGMPPDLLDWLGNALQGGALSAGLIRFHGNPQDLGADLARLGTQVDVRARVEHAAVRFHPEWPLIDEVAGVLTVRDRELKFIASQARTTGVALHDALVRVPDLASRAPALLASGYADGETRELVRYLAQTPLGAPIAAPLQGIDIEGRTRMDLKLDVPLLDATRTRASGTVQLYANRVQFASDMPRLTDLSGRVDFTDASATARGVGRFLDAPVALSVASGREGDVLLSLEGTAGVREAAAVWPFPLAQHLHGQTAYRAALRLTPAAVEVTIDSDLKGVAFALPAPLHKAAGESLALHARRVFDPAHANEGAGGTLELTLGQRMAVDARFAPVVGVQGGGDRVGIALGNVRATAPENPGLVVDAVLDAIDLDAWNGLIEVGSGAPQRPGVALAPGPESAPEPALKAINLQARSLTAFGRVLHQARVRAHPAETGWTLSIASDEATGDLSWNPRQQGHIAGHFSHLAIPEPALPVATAPPRGNASPRLNQLPGMTITAERFRSGGHELGRLALDAANEPAGWRIGRLEVVAPEGAIRAQGLWRHPGTDAEVDASVQVSFEDGGRYLARLGQPGTLSGAAGVLKGDLRWRGVPYAVDFPSLSGQMSLQAGRGQFLKVEPGVGRLLGVLSLQALPRRIALDFHDVFSDGFAFDQIEASGPVDRGVLTLRDFRMGGPSASVQLTGSLDLANETQNLHARVIPEVRDSLAAVAGIALVNPLVGLGTFIAQRLLYDPLGLLFSYDYDISGSWREPRVASHVAGPTTPPMRTAVPARKSGP